MFRMDCYCVGTFIVYSTSGMFEVSARIREGFENGRDYYAMYGKSLLVPRLSSLRPDTVALDWHNNCRFLG